MIAKKSEYTWRNRIKPFPSATITRKTGHVGDGKICVYDVEAIVKIRTGESGVDVLQGKE